MKQEIGVCDRDLDRRARADERCRRLQTIPGVGPQIATAIVAAVGDPRQFRNGRQMATWLGLVPKQHSTGGQTLLSSISKRGDKHVRSLVVHGARSLVVSVQRSKGDRGDRLRRWVAHKLTQKHVNRVIVAVANKNVRMMWALWAHGEDYKPNPAVRL